MSDATAREAAELFYRTMPVMKKIFLHSDHDRCVKMPRHLYATLLCVHFNGKQKMSGISDRLGLSKPLVTQHVDRLVDDGFFRRVNDSDDRRIVFIEMTAKGSKYAREVASFYLEKGTRALSALPPSDIRRFSECVRTLSEILSRIDKAEGKTTA